MSPQKGRWREKVVEVPDEGSAEVWFVRVDGSPSTTRGEAVVRCLPFLLLPGCLLGLDPLKGAPNVPTLASEPVLLAPLPNESGEVWAREGTDVVVELALVSPIDLDLSEIRLDDGVMSCAQPDPDVPLYRCSRRMEGTESNGAKGLAGVLAFGDGATTARLVSAPLLEADFVAPSAACILSPRVANARDDITLVLTPSEPLSEVPSVISESDDLSVVYRERVEGQYVFELVGTPGVNVEGYVLRIEGRDRAGNPQRGASLCAEEDRTGTLLGLGPALVAQPQVQATPSVGLGGVPEVRAGAVVTVAIPTAEPIDASASTVTLSGLELVEVEGEPNTWTAQLDGSEGDGFKNLDARLVDAAGNELRVQRPAVVRFDFTPPSGSCFLSPNPANGQQAIRLTLSPSEPLQGPPVVGSSEVGLGSPTFDGTRWVVPVIAPAGVSTAYTIDVEATDRVGNTAVGDVFCPLADRTGEAVGVEPAVVGDPTLTVVSGPQAPDEDGILVGLGAVVEVGFATNEELDVELTSVLLGDLPMTWDEVAGLWRRTIASGDPDGRKALTLSLVDAVGNRQVIQRPDLAVRVDLTPPTAGCLLFPNFANGESQVRLQLFATEPLSGDGPMLTDVAPLEPELEAATETTATWVLRQPTPRVDIPLYVAKITATDRVGNTQEGDSLCTVSERTGSIKGVGPAVLGGAVLEVTPSLASSSGWPRARAGAQVSLSLPTEEPVDPARSFVALGNFPLESADGQVWTGTLDASIGDGTKLLTATLVDDAGNVLVVQDPTLGLLADFTAPAVASAGLTRSPFFASAEVGQGAVLVTSQDPRTGQPVSASLRVTATEDLGVSPVLAVEGPGALAFVAEPTSARLASWSLPEIPSGQDGSYTFSVVLEDELGNVSEPVPLDVTLVVDTVGPAQGPDVSSPGLVSYLREPWGASTLSGGARFVVTSGPGAVEPGTLVVAENASGGQLGTAVSDGAGGFSLVLGADVSILQVRSHDAAGNPSPPAVVRDITWTATLAGKVAGSTFENPHRFLESTALRRPVGTELGSVLATTGARVPWEAWDRPESESPPPRGLFAAAYDAARGVVVVFGGGSTVDGTLADTWEWDGLTWTRRAPVVSPSARIEHAMAYDGARGVVVLFGGVGLVGGACGVVGERECSDTWEWDGIAWTRRSPEVSPPARESPRLAYDVRRGVTVLYGGLGTSVGGCGDPASSLCSDTWEWDGERWTERVVEVSPPSRLLHAMAYDARRERTVLFGGEGWCAGGNYNTCNDTWEWDGQTWSLRQGGPLPVDRSDHAMVYDEARGVTVLHSGFDVAYDVLEDVWEWDGVAWTERAPEGGTPGRWGHGMAYDAARQMSVVFSGGTADDTLSPDTWEWDGERWFRRAATSPPRPRAVHALVEDAARGVLVMFGGFNADAEVMGDTWEWDGASWVDRTPALPEASPVPRRQHAMVYDPVRGVSLLFGGFADDNIGECGLAESARCNDLWAWDGLTWTPIPAEDRPPARWGHRLAYDEARDVVVLFGGVGWELGGCGAAGTTACSDTWEWDGVQWREVSPLEGASPPPRDNHGMVYDPLRGVTVVFGGSSEISGACGTPQAPYCGDTWEWDGVAWSPRVFSEGPSARRAFGMAFVPGRDGVVLFGGRAQVGSCQSVPGTGICADTWVLDGGGWREISPSLTESPPPRIDGFLAYDGESESTVMFAGFGIDATLGSCAGEQGPLSFACGDTWRLPSVSRDTPGHLFTVPFANAGASGGVLQAVTARWVAGGAGTEEGLREEGAALVVWDGLRWRTLASHAAGTAAPGALCAQVVASDSEPEEAGCTRVVSAELLSTLFRRGPERVATFAVRPIAPVGTDEAEIRSEDVAVTVRYRLPGD